MGEDFCDCDLAAQAVLGDGLVLHYLAVEQIAARDGCCGKLGGVREADAERVLAAVRDTPRSSRPRWHPQNPEIGCACGG